MSAVRFRLNQKESRRWIQTSAVVCVCVWAEAGGGGWSVTGRILTLAGGLSPEVVLGFCVAFSSLSRRLRAPNIPFRGRAEGIERRWINKNKNDALRRRSDNNLDDIDNSVALR